MRAAGRSKRAPASLLFLFSLVALEESCITSTFSLSQKYIDYHYGGALMALIFEPTAMCCSTLTEVSWRFPNVRRLESVMRCDDRITTRGTKADPATLSLPNSSGYVNVDMRRLQKTECILSSNCPLQMGLVFCVHHRPIAGSSIKLVSCGVP